jgi:hypothetical protein
MAPGDGCVPSSSITVSFICGLNLRTHRARRSVNTALQQMPREAATSRRTSILFIHGAACFYFAAGQLLKLTLWVDFDR